MSGKNKNDYGEDVKYIKEKIKNICRQHNHKFS